MGKDYRNCLVLLVVMVFIKRGSAKNECGALPAADTNGVVTGTFSEGDTATFACNANYALPVGAKATTDCTSGSWPGTAPVCLREKVANEFLVSKWKIWYKFQDVNHDGLISMADVKVSRSKFSELHHLDAEKKNQVMKNFDKWWTEFIFRGQTGEITETQFVDALDKDFKSDKKSFRGQMNKCFDMLFNVIDTNLDMSITKEEFIIAFKAYDALNTKLFKAYAPENGLVPLRTIVQSWVDFATSEDASKESIVKTAFEAGV